MTEFEKATAKVEKYTRKLAKAQNDLGWMYYVGLGVKQDYAQAVRWWTKAAEQGYAIAQFNMGFMYYYARGVKEDYAEAVRWWTNAAEQGHIRVYSYLGYMYYKGEGVEQNDAEAVRWYTKAAEQGNESAQEMVDKLTKEMESKND